MDFFDYIKCEYPLPLPEDILKEDMPDWSNFDFQTKSFLFLSASSNEHDRFMGGIDIYNIDEEGEIYKEVVERKYVESTNALLDVMGISLILNYIMYIINQMVSFLPLLVKTSQTYYSKLCRLDCLLHVPIGGP